MGKLVVLLLIAGLLIGLFAGGIFGPVPVAMADKLYADTERTRYENEIKRQRYEEEIKHQHTINEKKAEAYPELERIRAETWRNVMTILSYGVVALVILLVSGLFAIYITRAVIGDRQANAPPRDGAPPGSDGQARTQPVRVNRQTEWETSRQRQLEQSVWDNLAATEANQRKQQSAYQKQQVPKGSHARPAIQHSKADGDRQENIKNSRRVKG